MKPFLLQTKRIRDALSKVLQKKQSALRGNVIFVIF